MTTSRKPKPARVLQRTYHSWQELSEGYLLGREFWGVKTATDDILLQRAEWLLKDPSSPWKKLAWNTPL